MSDTILVEQSGHVETWTINLPETRNPISSIDVIEAIEENVNRITGDPGVKCVVLTGAGKAFSAGGNVKQMIERTGKFAGTPYELRNSYRQGIQRIPRALHGCDVPFVAAVNGPAVGAGCDLAMLCDLRIASENAWFAERFVQLGIVPGDGGAWLLRRAIGPARAAEMILTGDRIDAQTALEWGLVSKVCAPGDLMAEAHGLADRVAKNPAPALRMAKQLLRESGDQPLSSVLEMSAAMQALAHHTPEHREALDNLFTQKP